MGCFIESAIGGFHACIVGGAVHEGFAAHFHGIGGDGRACGAISEGFHIARAPPNGGRVADFQHISVCPTLSFHFHIFTGVDFAAIHRADELRCSVCHGEAHGGGFHVVAVHRELHAHIAGVAGLQGVGRDGELAGGGGAAIGDGREIGLVGDFHGGCHAGMCMIPLCGEIGCHFFLVVGRISDGEFHGHDATHFAHAIIFIVGTRLHTPVLCGLVLQHRKVGGRHLCGGGVDALCHIAEVGIVADFHAVEFGIFHRFPFKNERQIHLRTIGGRNELRVVEFFEVSAEEHGVVFIAHAVHHTHRILPFVALVFRRDGVGWCVGHPQQVVYFLGEGGGIHGGRHGIH